MMSHNRCVNPLTISCCGISKYRLTTRLNTTSLIYIVILDKIERKFLIIDVACSLDIGVKGKEKEKIENYQYLKRELKRIWKLSRVTVVPVIIGTLGTFSKDIEKWSAETGVTCRLESLQIACLPGAARILRKV